MCRLMTKSGKYLIDNAGNGGSDTVTFCDPRTYGVRAGFKF